MTGEELKSWYQKELFTLNMLQMKTNKERCNKEESYLNYTAIIKYSNY